MNMEKRPSGKCRPSEHLKQYLKSSYKERLDWLEEANAFRSDIVIRKVRKPKRKKPSSKLKRNG
ncbi:MAG: hypothetical protein QME66_02285 [Candidatus Eisenbacteria bacterium]|nr:hypothetical protein [Candidatus Eisenbacteria bacterium]